MEVKQILCLEAYFLNSIGVSMATLPHLSHLGCGIPAWTSAGGGMHAGGRDLVHGPHLEAHAAAPPGIAATLMVAENKLIGKEPNPNATLSWAPSLSFSLAGEFSDSRTMWSSV